jgi:glycosyltransferase involved in cell wall biosynthesis
MAPSSEPLVSIIIPTFNRAHLIGETLESIRAQRYQNWECIVVDDGSSDNTDEVLKTYLKEDTRFQYYHRPADRPKGANACRNYGFEVSKGEFINWFDDDDIMLPEFIRMKIELFCPKLDYILCGVTYVDPDLNFVKDVYFKKDIDLFRDLVLINQSILTPTILFRRSSLLKEGLFDEKILRGQEMEFLSRIFFNISKEKFKILDVPLFQYRQHVNSTSGREMGYLKTYNLSYAYIYTSNFERSLCLRDNELIENLYKKLINLLSESVSNQHFEVFKLIQLTFYKAFFTKNFLFYVQLFSVYFGLFIIGRKSYKMEKYFKNYNLFQ